MDYVETEADTVDQAIEEALLRLGVQRDQVSVDILSHGKRGIFGFGAQKARIRAELRKPVNGPGERISSVAAEPPATGSPVSAAETAAVAAKAASVLAEILKLMEVGASVRIKSADPSDEIVIEVNCDNGGLLIGRKGQTLEALQYLVTRIVAGRHSGESPHIVIDVDNYRERRRKSLEDMALHLGEKAKRQRKTVAFDALSAADRRIVHAILQDDPWLTTKSLGQGAYRRLLIIPEGDRKGRAEEKSASGEQPEGSRSGKGGPGSARASQTNR